MSFNARASRSRPVLALPTTQLRIDTDRTATSSCCRLVAAGALVFDAPRGFPSHPALDHPHHALILFLSLLFSLTVSFRNPALRCRSRRTLALASGHPPIEAQRASEAKLSSHHILSHPFDIQDHTRRVCGPGRRRFLLGRLPVPFLAVWCASAQACTIQSYGKLIISR